MLIGDAPVLKEDQDTVESLFKGPTRHIYFDASGFMKRSSMMRNFVNRHYPDRSVPIHIRLGVSLKNTSEWPAGGTG